MRQVTREICQAFINGRKSTKSNSHTDGKTLWLHGNAIARHTPSGIEVTTAGWDTTTTKERLNGLADLLYKKRPFHTKNFELKDAQGDWNGDWKLILQCCNL